MWRIKTPRYLLLGALQPGVQELAFEIPKGDHYHIVIGVPKSEHGKTQVYGIISLKSGSNLITEFNFDTATCAEGNWLDRENLTSFVVTLPRNGTQQTLDGWLANRSSISANIEANGTNVTVASFWLYYLE